MVVIGVDGANAVVRKQDILTVGMVGAKVEFRFDEKWDGLGKTAVFRQGNVTKDAPVYDGTVTIPWEVLQMAGVPVSIGVYGTNKEGTIVIPTVWVKTAPVQPGADPSGDESADPALPVWAQMQAMLGTMYQSTEQINAAKEEMLQAIEAGKVDIAAAIAAGNYYTKDESGAKFASAITGEMSGEIVAANDVSPVEHVVSVKAHGKNIFNDSDDFVEKGQTVYTYANGALTVTGGYVVKWLEVEPGMTYTFSATSQRSGKTGGGVYLRAYTSDKVNYDEVKYDASMLSPRCTFTLGPLHTFLRVVFYGSTEADLTESATYSEIQLEKGGYATDYVPYIDPAGVAIIRCATGSEHQEGDRYVANEDGTVDGVTSLAPDMTLYTETPGMLLDVKYNRDTNAVIAELLEKMFPAARITSVSLPASKWAGSGNLYSQVVSIAGVTANSQVNLTPSVEQLSVFYEKDLTFITENDGGVVTVYVIGQKPQNDYTIQADVVEVTT